MARNIQLDAGVFLSCVLLRHGRFGNDRIQKYQYACQRERAAKHNECHKGGRMNPDEGQQ